MYLLNPMTKGFKKIPTPMIDTSFWLDLGFCFDFISNDYKLLRIVQSDVSDYGYFTFVLEAELYSTKTNSWKGIQVPKTVKKIFLGHILNVLILKMRYCILKMVKSFCHLIHIMRCLEYIGFLSLCTIKESQMCWILMVLLQWSLNQYVMD